MTKGKYSYEVTNGIKKGNFNIYQGRNGKIYLSMGNGLIDLNQNQIIALGIDVYSLIDFDHNLYKKAYES